MRGVYILTLDDGINSWVGGVYTHAKAAKKVLKQNDFEWNGYVFVKHSEKNEETIEAWINYSFLDDDELFGLE